MSADRDVTRIVRSWLEEGVTALPDRVLDTVLDQVPATRQRRAWWPARRLQQMNTSMRAIAALAAVVVLAVVLLAAVGIKLIPVNLGVGGSPAPTATPSPTTVPTPAPTLPSGSIPPGTYQAGFVTYTLPAGWNAPAAGAPTILKADAKPPTGMAVDLWQNIATVYSDPCHWQTTGAAVGPTAQDLATALLAQPRGSPATRGSTGVREFGGFTPEQEVDLMVPLDVNLADCDGGEYKSWTDASGGDRFNQGPGQFDLLDIVNVGGRTLVIQRSFYQANSDADLAELKAIVESITITP